MKSFSRQDMNENPYNIFELIKKETLYELDRMQLNQYPDGNSTRLREEIAGYAGVERNQVLVGNGSDELILLALQTFAGSGNGVMVHSPTFSMYQHYGGLLRCRLIHFEADGDFNLDADSFKAAIKREQPKLLILCNPNNPTGKVLELSQIQYLLEDYRGITLIDEAYYEFYGKTAVSLIATERVIITRTFSKAFGLAGIRLGYMLGGEKLIKAADCARSPFNVSSFSQAAASIALKSYPLVEASVKKILQDKEKLFMDLKSIEGIEIFESQANFFLVRTDKAERLINELNQEGIRVRCFEDERLANCFRITVGLQEDNERIVEAIRRGACE